jgi:hypothetical protein
VTTETKKPSALFEAMRLDLRNEIPPGSHPMAEHLAAIKWLCGRLEEAEGRLAKLEALNPEARTIIGVTTSGAAVHGVTAVVHELASDAECRWCGQTYAEHLPPKQPNRPKARCPCLCWREHFVPRKDNE